MTNDKYVFLAGGERLDVNEELDGMNFHKGFTPSDNKADAQQFFRTFATEHPHQKVAMYERVMTSIPQLPKIQEES